MWLVSSFNGYDGFEKEFLVRSNCFCNHLWRQLIRSAFKSNHCAIPPPMIPWELLGCLLSTGRSSLFSDWSSLFQDTLGLQMKSERRRRRLNRASGIQTRPGWMEHCGCTTLRHLRSPCFHFIGTKGPQEVALLLVPPHWPTICTNNARVPLR